MKEEVDVILSDLEKAYNGLIQIPTVTVLSPTHLVNHSTMRMMLRMSDRLEAIDDYNNTAWSVYGTFSDQGYFIEGLTDGPGPNLSAQNKITFMSWWKATDLIGSDTITKFYQHPASTYKSPITMQLWFKTDNTIISTVEIATGYSTSISVSADVTAIFSDWDWHHIAMVLGDGKLILYVDAVNVGEMATTTSVHGVNSVSKSFRSFNDSWYIDDFSLFFAAFSANKISDIYTNGRGTLASAAQTQIFVPVVLSYVGQPFARDANTYTVTATVNHPDYEGEFVDNFVITPLELSFNVLNNTANINTVPLLPSIATIPSNVNWALTYDELLEPPTVPGVYPVTVESVDNNYTGSHSFMFVIFPIYAFNPDIMRLYERLSINTPRTNALIDFTAEYKYRLITDYTTVGHLTEDGSLVIDDQDNRLFVVQSICDLFKLTESAIVIPENIDPSVDSTNDPIIVNVTDQHGIPIIGPYTPIIYLNGHALVRDVDFTIVTQTETDGNNIDWVMSQIVIQNAEYLIPSDNKLEIYISKDRSTMFGSAHGFSEEEIPFGIKDTTTTFKNLSVFTAYGMTESTENVPVWGPDWNFEESEYAPRIGRLCSVRTIAPSLLYEYMLNYKTATSDLDRIAILKAYYATLPSSWAKLVAVPDSHKLYSVFLHVMIRDALNEILVIPLDYTVENLPSIVEPYLWIKAIDVTLRDDMKQDYRFIDVRPSYQVVDAPVHIRRFVQDIERIYLDSQDRITDGRIRVDTEHKF